MIDDEELITGLAVELWRLRQAALQAAAAVEDKAQRDRQLSKLRYCVSRIDALLESADLRMPDFAGQDYHAGLPVRPVNLSVDDGNDLVIARTLEPTLIRKGRTLAAGTVIVEHKQRGDA